MSNNIIESAIKENDFTIDNMGRIVILDNEELLGMVSGGTYEKINREAKSPLFDQLIDPLPLMDTLGNNCNCGSGSGSSGTGSGTGYSGSGCSGGGGCSYV